MAAAAATTTATTTATATATTTATATATRTSEDYQGQCRTAGQRADGAPAKKPTRYGSAGANAGRGLQIEVKCDRRANGAPRDGRTRAETLTFEDHRGQ